MHSRVRKATIGGAVARDAYMHVRKVENAHGVASIPEGDKREKAWVLPVEVQLYVVPVPRQRLHPSPHFEICSGESSFLSMKSSNRALTSLLVKGPSYFLAQAPDL